MRLLIAGGGTGGHLFPGIALAEEVAARPGGEVLFVGTERGLESRVVPAAGFGLETIDVTGIKRTGAGGLFRGLARLPRAYAASLGIMRRFRPDLVVGVGGYASGPVVLAAALSGRPTAVLEQNSIPGVTNRILARFVRAVFVAFDESRRFFPARKVRLLGNPVRRSFRQAAAEAPRAESRPPPFGEPVLLVCGGSQGARAVNDLVTGAGEILARRGALPRVVHQAGKADEDRVRARYTELGILARVQVHAFIEDMVSAYSGADLIVGRAGALTLAELAVIGRPAILIPLPTAADDHQSRNAAELESAGAAVTMPQAEATPEKLADLVAALLGDTERRERMGRAMRALGRPAAARDIVDELEKMVAKADPRSATDGDVPQA